MRIEGEMNLLSQLDLEGRIDPQLHNNPFLRFYLTLGAVTEIDQLLNLPAPDVVLVFG